MGKQIKPLKSARKNQYFVEVTAADGLKHHVGPFKKLTRAQDWIAQNERSDVTAHRLHRHA